MIEMSETDILISRTKSGGVLARSDIPGWEADIRDRGHHLGFVIRVRRSGETPTKTFRTTTDARWASARQYASELIKTVAEEAEQRASEVSAMAVARGAGDQIADPLEKALSQRDDLDRYSSAK